MTPEAEKFRAEVRRAIAVTEFHEPPPGIPMAESIADTEARLGVPMPPWLRQVYECCNGFSGPTGVAMMYPLDGYEGVGEFNLFLRGLEWAPTWLDRAIVFGDNGAGRLDHDPLGGAGRAVG